ncbi:MAG: GrpB family protein [Saprospiraceae bacterium]
MEIPINFEKGRPIIVIPYQERWPAEFQRIATDLQQSLGDLALRIDHIGSTSVPGLAAKDVIDIQITVADLNDPQIPVRLTANGYTRFSTEYRDVFVGMDDASPQLEKRMVQAKAGDRRAHIHIRELGRFNQRYPLLFRDYLRASAVTRLSYALIKERLAQLFPESSEGYYFIKDPLMDLMYEAAEQWARLTNWAP